MGPETVKLTPQSSAGGGAFAVIAGPCVIESESATMEHARIVQGIARRLGTEIIFKASFDKANRSSGDSFRGPGLAEGLRILARVRNELGLPVTTDVHEAAQCEPAAEVCDVIQIPAFLCRQTDLLVAAGRTGRPVNLKKAQFMAPDEMRRAVDKVRATGGSPVVVTERGTCFGYHNWIVDMRSFPALHADGVVVLYDATHSVQVPGGAGAVSGGQREYVEPLALAAVAAGADGLFMEVHPDPPKALSDPHSQLEPVRAERLLASVIELRRTLVQSVWSSAGGQQ